MLSPTPAKLARGFKNGNIKISYYKTWIQRSYNLEGISPLWPLLPGKAIKVTLFYFTSPQKHLNIKCNQPVKRPCKRWGLIYMEVPCQMPKNCKLCMCFHPYFLRTNMGDDFIIHEYIEWFLVKKKKVAI